MWERSPMRAGRTACFRRRSLGQTLKELGLRLRRFKTGTPARVLRSSIDFTGLQEQPGDDPVIPFSYDTAAASGKQGGLPYHLDQ